MGGEYVLEPGLKKMLRGLFYIHANTLDELISRAAYYLYDVLDESREPCIVPYGGSGQVCLGILKNGRHVHACVDEYEGYYSITDYYFS